MTFFFPIITTFELFSYTGNNHSPSLLRPGAQRFLNFPCACGLGSAGASNFCLSNRLLLMQFSWIQNISLTHTFCYQSWEEFVCIKSVSFFSLSIKFVLMQLLLSLTNFICSSECFQYCLRVWFCTVLTTEWDFSCFQLFCEIKWGRLVWWWWWWLLLLFLLGIY